MIGKMFIKSKFNRDGHRHIILFSFHKISLASSFLQSVFQCPVNKDYCVDKEAKRLLNLFCMTGQEMHE